MSETVTLGWKVGELWTPCRLGHPDPERCPRCTPPEELRCPEYREVLMGDHAFNTPPPEVTVRKVPCRVIGRKHRVHRDGMGNSWWVDMTCGRPNKTGGTCFQRVREVGAACWRHVGMERVA